jgi:hypothetical protein
MVRGRTEASAPSASGGLPPLAPQQQAHSMAGASPGPGPGHDALPAATPSTGGAAGLFGFGGGAAAAAAAHAAGARDARKDAANFSFFSDDEGD